MANLIYLNEFKTYKNINNDKDDAKLGLIIDSVIKFVQNYCNRTFIDYYSTNKIEYFDGVYNNSVLVSEFPIVTLSTVSVTTDGGQTFTDLTEFTDFTYNKDLGEIRSLYPAFVYTTIFYDSLRVTYKGGYSRAPDDLKIAALDLVEYYRSEEYVPRKTLGAASTERVLIPDNTARLPPHIRRILESYRQVV